MSATETPATTSQLAAELQLVHRAFELLNTLDHVRAQRAERIARAVIERAVAVELDAFGPDAALATLDEFKRPPATARGRMAWVKLIGDVRAPLVGQSTADDDAAETDPLSPSTMLGAAAVGFGFLQAALPGMWVSVLLGLCFLAAAHLGRRAGHLHITYAALALALPHFADLFSGVQYTLGDVRTIVRWDGNYLDTVWSAIPWVWFWGTVAMSLNPIVNRELPVWRHRAVFTYVSAGWMLLYLIALGLDTRFDAGGLLLVVAPFRG